MAGKTKKAKPAPETVMSPREIGRWLDDALYEAQTTLYNRGVTGLVIQEAFHELRLLREALPKNPDNPPEPGSEQREVEVK